jgi:regulator of protease activity HflC (stomatin/prohibitin superfamily)
MAEGSVLCLFGSIVLVVITVLVAMIRIVPEFQRLAVYRLGRYIGERGPGLVIVLPIIDRAVRIDTRDKLIKARASQKMYDAIGETKTVVHNEGSVEVAGEIWDAISLQSIPPGTRIRVKRVILEIEMLSSADLSDF